MGVAILREDISCARRTRTFIYQGMEAFQVSLGNMVMDADTVKMTTRSVLSTQHHTELAGWNMIKRVVTLGPMVMFG